MNHRWKIGVPAGAILAISVFMLLVASNVGWLPSDNPCLRENTFIAPLLLLVMGLSVLILLFEASGQKSV